jgi:hypothetical protein
LEIGDTAGLETCGTERAHLGRSNVLKSQGPLTLKLIGINSPFSLVNGTLRA